MSWTCKACTFTDYVITHLVCTLCDTVRDDFTPSNLSGVIEIDDDEIIPIQQHAPPPSPTVQSVMPPPASTVNRVPSISVALASTPKQPVPLPPTTVHQPLPAAAAASSVNHDFTSDATPSSSPSASASSVTESEDDSEYEDDTSKRRSRTGTSNSPNTSQTPTAAIIKHITLRKPSQRVTTAPKRSYREVHEDTEDEEDAASSTEDENELTANKNKRQKNIKEPAPANFSAESKIPTLSSFSTTVAAAAANSSSSLSSPHSKDDLPTGIRRKSSIPEQKAPQLDDSSSSRDSIPAAAASSGRMKTRTASLLESPSLPPTPVAAPMEKAKSTPPSNAVVKAPSEEQKAIWRDLEIDHSPLWALRGSDALRRPFHHSTSLASLFERFVPRVASSSNTVSEPENLIRSDSDIFQFVELLFRVAQIHPEPFTIPPHIMDCVWRGILSPHVTYAGAQRAYPSLSKLQALSPCSFLPSKSVWVQWCEEVLKFSNWLQHKDQIVSKNVKELAKDVEASSNPSTPNDSSTAASSSSSSNDYIAQMYLLRDEYKRQETIRNQLSEQAYGEGYWAKWCIRFALMHRIFEMDLIARQEGLERFAKNVVKHPSASVTTAVAEMNAIGFANSKPLLLRLIEGAKNVLVIETTIASEDTLAQVSAPKQAVEDVNAILARTIRKKGRPGRPSKRNSKQGSAAAAAAAANDSIDTQQSASNDEPSEDDVDINVVLHWWQNLLVHLGYTTDQPGVKNEKEFTSFRKPEYLTFYQGTIAPFVHLLTRIVMAHQDDDY